MAEYSDGPIICCNNSDKIELAHLWNHSDIAYSKLDELETELAKLLNMLGFDTECNTPDYMLATYMVNALTNYMNIKHHKDVWQKKNEQE